MHRIAVAVVAFCLLAGLGSYAQGSDLPILPPSDEQYSLSEQAVLEDAIDRLDNSLRRSEYASMKYYPAEWLSRHFAAYTQGVLAGMGYTSVLVGRQTGSEEHAWLLVSIPLGMAGTIAWIPVEATPDSGRRQIYLGTIPLTTTPSGLTDYESPYRMYDGLIELPDNIPPSPAIRPIPSRGFLGEDVRFLGTQSTDADGEIVLWFWSLGDETSSTDRSPEHRYAEKGTYRVSLTVIDSRGESRTTTTDYKVGDPRPEPSGSGCSSCGGGG